MYRMSSDIFPWCSEYEIAELPDYLGIKRILNECGNLAKETNQRITFHPSPYGVLASDRPDVVINIGDFADMPSLSTHDVKGSKYFEGLRYKKDVEVVKEAMKKLLQPLRDLQKTQRDTKHKVYKPRMILTLGNHENRISRAVNNNPTLEGLISVKDLDYDKDWEVYGFLQPVFISGVGFSPVSYTHLTLPTKRIV